MGYICKIKPNLDRRSTEVLNLTVLQRADPYIEEILMTATHVSLYALNVEQSEWSRKNVEGSLFVVKRNSQPRFQFIVMNRRSTENLVENILGDFEYEVQLPYLFYRNAAQEVNGIWFYTPQECKNLSDLFNRIFNAYSNVPSSATPSSRSGEEGHEGVALSSTERALEPSSSSSSSTIDVPEDSSILKFFNVRTSHPMRSQTPMPPPVSALSTVPEIGRCFPPMQILPLLRPPKPPLLRASSSPNLGPTITREKVRDALLNLVQDNQFVEMFYQAIVKVQDGCRVP